MVQQLRAVIVCGLAGLLLATPARASIGPFGGDVLTLLADPGNPSRIYAGTWAGGAFKSEDGAATWREINDGLDVHYVFSLAIDPSRPEVVYAGSVGVFKSVDAGEHWANQSLGLPERNIDSLAVNPQAPNTLYAGD